MLHLTCGGQVLPASITDAPSAEGKHYICSLELIYVFDDLCGANSAWFGIHGHQHHRNIRQNSHFVASNSSSGQCTAWRVWEKTKLLAKHTYKMRVTNRSDADVSTSIR